MLDRFIEWQKKKYSPRQRVIFALTLSAFFIFVFIPAFPLFLFEQADKAFNFPKILPLPFNTYLGLPLAVFGLVLFIWTVSLFLRIGKGTQTPLIPTQRLVEVGPFAYSRNPMFFGVILWVLGLGVLLNSYSFIGIGLIVPMLYLVYIKLVEEKELELRFGNQYLEYKKKVPFLIPFIFV